MKVPFALLFMLTMLIACDNAREKKAKVQYADLQATNFKGDIRSIKITY